MSETVKQEKTSESSTDTTKKERMTKNEAVRRLLVSAALATSIVSWLATANGLYKFVFIQHMWQATIISASIQGSLFALSTRGIWLLKKIWKDNRSWIASMFKSGSIIFLWLILLLASSIFSYVFISRTAYPDKALMEDANQILHEYTLEKNYELDSYCTIIAENYKEIIEDYLKLLGTEKHGIEILQRDTTKIDSFITVFSTYEEGKKAHPDFESYDTISIQNSLTNLRNGEMNPNEMESLKELLDTTEETINKRIKWYSDQIDALNKSINEDTERLKGMSASFSQYKPTLDKKAENERKRDTYNEILSSLNPVWSAIVNSQATLKDIMGGSNTKIFSNATTLATLMVAEEIDTTEMMNMAQAIYLALLEDGTPREDGRIVDFPDFKNSVQHYNQIQRAKKEIHEEIKIINNLQMNGEIESEGDSVVDTSEANTQKKNVSNVLDVELNRSFWKSRLVAMESRLEEIPDKTENPKTNKIDSIEKKDYVSKITGLNRQYLVDLNEFERAYSLLFKDHPYKDILIFAFGFAFFIDLFSLATGLLIYFFPKASKHMGKE